MTRSFRRIITMARWGLLSCLLSRMVTAAGSMTRSPTSASSICCGRSGPRSGQTLASFSPARPVSSAFSLSTAGGRAGVIRRVALTSAPTGRSGEGSGEKTASGGRCVSGAIFCRSTPRRNDSRSRPH